MPLTDVKIRQAKPSIKPVRMTDSNGLYLEVTTKGSKLWRYRYKIQGKENLYAIGEYPSLSLQEARKARDEARLLVKRGIHPAHMRKKGRDDILLANANTFELIAREWLEEKSKRCTKQYLSQVTACFENNAFHRIGKIPIKEITSVMILSLMREMAKRGSNAYALKLRHWISGVFKYAIVTLRADADPTFVLQGAIERPKVKTSMAMKEHDISDFKSRLAKYHGHYTTIYAIKLMMYTFVRTTEMRRATWDEFNFDAKEWRIPSERMKMRRIHIVPLSRQVIALLNELKQISHGTHLFPSISRPNKVMSENTINMALYYMGYKQYEWTGHDFRATASTHLHEMGFRDELVEIQLAHIDKNKTRGAYNHARYLPERIEMMQQWADWIDRL